MSIHIVRNVWYPLIMEYEKDHPGAYEKSYTQFEILSTRNHHWRTTPNNTGTFIFSKKLFTEDFEFLSTEDNDFIRSFRLRTLHGRKYYSPLPSISTHCIQMARGFPYSMLPRGIDWERLFNE